MCNWQHAEALPNPILRISIEMAAFSIESSTKNAAISIEIPDHDSSSRNVSDRSLAFVLRMVDFIMKMMELILMVMNFVLKLMEFVGV